jgi:hypothetical protein
MNSESLNVENVPEMMLAKPQILIITPHTFGHSSLPFNWCQYLTEHYDIKCLCLKDILNREPIQFQGVTVKYVHAEFGRLSRYVSFLIESFRTVRRGFDLCIVMYFPGCATIKLFNPLRQKFIFYIESGPIGTSRIKRIFDNRLLRLEALLFRYKFVLSESLRRKLHMSSTVPLQRYMVCNLQFRQFSFPMREIRPMVLHLYP